MMEIFMKIPAFSIPVILILALTACSGSNPSTQQFDPNQNNNASNAELPLASKLVIGSFKLEGTDNAITTDQAAGLLPLWQVYLQLTTSDTAAQEEISALADQIQETMTPDQAKAINAWNLTPQDVFATMQEQGIQFSGNRQSNQANGNQQNGGNFSPPGGGEFFVRPQGSTQDGGPGGGGPGGFNPGQNLSPEQIATAQARRAENGGGNFRFTPTPAPLIEALIKLLQAKAGS